MCVAHVCSCLPNSFASGSAEVLEYLSSGLLYIVITIVFLRFPVYKVSARKKLHSRTLLFFFTICSWHVPVKQPTRKLRYLSCWRQILLEFISSGSTILLCSLCLTRSPTALLSVVVLFRLLLCSKISSFRTSPSMLSRINTNLHSLTKLPVNPLLNFFLKSKTLN